MKKSLLLILAAIVIVAGATTAILCINKTKVDERAKIEDAIVCYFNVDQLAKKGAFGNYLTPEQRKLYASMATANIENKEVASHIDAIINDFNCSGIDFTKPIYGYYDKSILRLTGIPRYDGLINKDKRQILITPTWRSYIAMPAMMGKTRPYNPSFKDTDYFKIYSSLLKDEKLLKTAKETGYKLIYLLHPVITAQACDYEQSEEIELLTADTINYEQILTESSLMVTDYSGVQFDFAYMRKPVVYYHPPKLPPHYKEGGFFYDTMGFGEICTEHKELVDVLCEYMKNNCQVTPKYRERQDDFFAFSDNDSCKRIYDDILEMQREANKK
jgi:CDP-glycerol glycerophosphotransferase (TagB/SpsB family)